MNSIIKYALIVLMGLTVTCYADSQERWKSGMINTVHLDNNAIVVSDIYYKLALSIKITGLNGKPMSRSSLKSGHMFSFLTRERLNMREIIELKEIEMKIDPRLR